MDLEAQSLLAVKWEEMWDRPLAELRESLNVVPLGAHGGALNFKFVPAVLQEVEKQAID